MTLRGSREAEGFEEQEKERVWQAEHAWVVKAD